MIRESKMRFRLEFFFSSIWEKKKTKNTVYKDNYISDISGMNTESSSCKTIVQNGKPVEKKRRKWNKNTNTNNSQTSRKMNEIKTETRKEKMYFIF